MILVSSYRITSTEVRLLTGFSHGVMTRLNLTSSVEARTTSPTFSISEPYYVIPAVYRASPPPHRYDAILSFRPVYDDKMIANLSKGVRVIVMLIIKLKSVVSGVLAVEEFIRYHGLCLHCIDLADSAV